MIFKYLKSYINLFIRHLASVWGNHLPLFDPFHLNDSLKCVFVFCTSEMKHLDTHFAIMHLNQMFSLNVLDKMLTSKHQFG